MADFNYYEAPSDAIFNEIKAKAIEIWGTYDDTYGYASGKIDRVKSIENVKDNAWYIVTMFDSENQQKLLSLVNQETRDALMVMFMNA